MNYQNIELINISQIKCDYTKEVDNTMLISSIEKKGLIYPIILQREENEQFSVISGKNRLRVFYALSLTNENFKKIPAIILERQLSEEEKQTIFFHENKIRQKITLLDEAAWIFSTLFFVVDNAPQKTKNFLSRIKKGIEYFFLYRSITINNSTSSALSVEQIEKITDFLTLNVSQRSLSTLYNYAQALLFNLDLQELIKKETVSLNLACKINKLLISDNSYENKKADIIIERIKQEANTIFDSNEIYKEVMYKEGRKDQTIKKLKDIQKGIKQLIIHAVNSPEEKKKIDEAVFKIEKIINKII